MPGKVTLCKRLGDMVPPDHPTLIRYAASSSSSSRSPRGGGRQGKGNSGKRPYQKRQLSKDDKLKKPKHIRDLFKSLRLDTAPSSAWKTLVTNMSEANRNPGPSSSPPTYKYAHPTKGGHFISQVWINRQAKLNATVGTFSDPRIASYAASRALDEYNAGCAFYGEPVCNDQRDKIVAVSIETVWTEIEKQKPMKVNWDSVENQVNIGVDDSDLMGLVPDVIQATLPGDQRSTPQQTSPVQARIVSPTSAANLEEPIEVTAVDDVGEDFDISQLIASPVPSLGGSPPQPPPPQGSSRPSPAPSAPSASSPSGPQPNATSLLSLNHLFASASRGRNVPRAPSSAGSIQREMGSDKVTMVYKTSGSLPNNRGNVLLGHFFTRDSAEYAIDLFHANLQSGDPHVSSYPHLFCQAELLLNVKKEVFR